MPGPQGGSVCRTPTFLQRQQRDGCAEPPTAQAHQVGLVRLHFQPFARLDQVQGSSLRAAGVGDEHRGTPRRSQQHLPSAKRSEVVDGRAQSSLLRTVIRSESRPRTRPTGLVARLGLTAPFVY